MLRPFRLAQSQNPKPQRRSQFSDRLLVAEGPKGLVRSGIPSRAAPARLYFGVNFRLKLSYPTTRS